MKNVKNLVLVLLVTAAFVGCKKDSCKGITCLNGGECIEGDCLCPTGYSGPQCEDFNACLNVTCLNGGTCVNGVCNCSTGYTGADCGSEVTPTSMRITKITVTDFVNSGWDVFPASSPDIFVNVRTGSTCSASGGLYSSGFHQDAYPGPNYDFVPTTPIVISNPTATIVICLYDDDLSGQDYMAGVQFEPYQSGADFPSVRTLTVTGLTCKVYYTYYW